MTAMKKKSPFCTYDELVQLRQDGLIMDLDFILMNPHTELKDEFESFCDAYERERNESAASDFLAMIEEALELGMEYGDA